MFEAFSRLLAYTKASCVVQADIPLLASSAAADSLFSPFAAGEQDKAPKTEGERWRSNKSRGNNSQSIIGSTAHVQSLRLTLHTQAPYSIICTLQTCLRAGSRSRSRIAVLYSWSDLRLRHPLCWARDPGGRQEAPWSAPKKIRLASSPHLHALVRPT